MNISKAARRALNPIERKIKSEPVEWAYFLRNNDGKELFNIKGHETGIPMGKRNRWYKLLILNNKKIFTHNHPGEKMNSLKLSINDVIVSIFQGCREVRAVSEDGFCHLAEIPKMNPVKKFKCMYNLVDYHVLLQITKTSIGFKEQYRKMQKKVFKDWGIKFRMIKLKESL